MFTTKPLLVSTILGSCVSVCLYHEKSRWGGINHFIMPDSQGKRLKKGKYGDLATIDLIGHFVSEGIPKHELKARVYGGANQFTGDLNLSVGQDNVDMALSILSRHGISVIDSDTGGIYGRKLLFSTAENWIKVEYIMR